SPDIARVAGDTTEAAEGDAELVRFALFDEVTRFFRSAAERTPHLLVLDDLHWADVPSLRLFEFFARETHAAPLLVVGTYRDVEVGPDTDAGRVLGSVIEKGTVLHLGGLAATEVAELLAATSGSLAETEFARAVHQQSGGNPLFVHELARLIRAQGRPLGSDRRVPDGVHVVINRRVARLTQACHRLLSVAAVMGAEFAIAPLARTARIDPDLALGLIGEAEAARLVAARPNAVGRYVFSHALVRDALYEALPLPARIEAHARAAETREEGGNLDEVAFHYVQAAPAGFVEKAISFSVAAGRRAVEQLAYESSAAHFQRALDALDLAPDDDRRTELLLELGDAHLRSGN